MKRKTKMIIASIILIVAGAIGIELEAFVLLSAISLAIGVIFAGVTLILWLIIYLEEEFDG